MERKGTGKRRRSQSPPNTDSRKDRAGKKGSLDTSRSNGRSGRTKLGTNEESMDQDLTHDMEDPEPETKVTEVKGVKADSRGGPLTELEDSNTRASVKDGSVKEHNTSANKDESLVDQTHYVVIPSYAAWFDYNSVHGIERRSLPEFFNAKCKSKSPEVYVAYRNFMIDTYRLTPHEYLTITACRRNLAGDVCSIMRVHAFLEQWGLINYQVLADIKPHPLGPPATAHFHILADTPAGLQPVNPGRSTLTAAMKQVIDLEENSKPGTLASVNEDSKSAGDGAVKSSEGHEENAPGSVKVVEEKTEKDKEDKSMEVDAEKSSVDKPTSAEPTPQQPVADKEPKAEKIEHSAEPTPKSEQSTVNPLLADQYAKGQIRSGMGFVKAPSTGSTVGRMWTDEETLHLLEAIEMYRDDWNKVADHVGSRTVEECIVHFLRLPIEDPYVDSLNLGSSPLGYQPIPFSQSGNPVMSTVAFLASIVDPRIAAAAAKAAIDEFSKIKDEVPQSMIEAHVKKVVEAFKEGKTTDTSYGVPSLDAPEKSEKSHNGTQNGTAGGEVSKENNEKDSESEQKVNGDVAPGEAEKTVSKVVESSEKEEEPSSEKATEGEADKTAETVSMDVSTTEGDKATTPKPSLKDPKLNEKEIANAAAVALSAAAVKAKHLSAAEERKIKSLVALLIETQMKKIEVMIRYL